MLPEERPCELFSLRLISSRVVRVKLRLAATAAQIGLPIAEPSSRVGKLDGLLGCRCSASKAQTEAGDREGFLRGAENEDRPLR